MKVIRNILLLTTWVTISVVYSQQIPNHFELNKNSLSKNYVDATPTGNSVEYIKFMDQDIWIATSSGVSKSTDGGESWTNYKFGDEGVSALAINNDTVWIATWHLQDGVGEDEAVGSGLHYSVDKGDTWIDIPQPQDKLTDTIIKYGNNEIGNLVWANPVFNLTRDIDFQNGTIWIANYFAGVYKSNDIGETWEKVVIPPDNLNQIHPDDTLSFTVSSTGGGLGFTSNLNHVIFSLKVIDDSTLLIGTAGGINLSKDGGNSWQKSNHKNQDFPISGNRIIDLDYDYSRNTIWAATWKADDDDENFGLSSSEDFGENWKTYLAGENVNDITYTKDISGLEDNILVATSNGIFRSVDIGKSWQLAPRMIDDVTNIPLTSSKFRAVSAILDLNNYNNIWFGTEGSGSAKLIETGNIWEGEWKVFVSSPKISSNAEAFAFPNPFTPDEEPVKIKYSFTGDSKSVTIRIFDFGMNLVRTVMQNVSRVGGNDFIDNWDGKDENNSIVPNGVYFFRIDIGDEEPLFGKIMVLM